MSIFELRSNYFVEKINAIKSDKRKYILFYNTLLSFLSKAISIITSFLIIPLSLKIVNKHELGVWFTISSFLGWISLLDLGIGNGLRNKLTEANAIQDYKEGKKLVSTAYFITAGVFVSAIVLFIIGTYYVNWVSFLNTTDIQESTLRWIINASFIGFALQMIVKLIFSIYYSNHNAGGVDILNLITQILIIICLYLTSILPAYKASLLTLILINNYIPFFFLAVTSVFFFKYSFNKIRPSFSHIKLSKAKSIFGLGFKFLILQLVSFILIGSQQFLIGKLFSQEQVVNFTIPQRYYSTLFVFWTIITTPYWSLLTEANHKGDFIWISKKLKELLMFLILIPIIGIALYFIAPIVYKYWIGKAYTQEVKLDLSILFFFCILCFNTTIVVFLNAFSRTKTQLVASILVTIGAIVCIIFFKYYFNLNTFAIPFISGLFLALAGIAVAIDLLRYIKLNTSKI